MKRLLLFLTVAGCNQPSGGPMDMATSTDDFGGLTGLHPTARKDLDGILVPGAHQLYVVGGDTAPFDNNVPVGQLPKAFVDETWRLDLTTKTWEKLTTSGSPGPRGGYALAWDGKRSRILLFAGRKGTASLPPAVNDLWAFDVATATWTQLMPSGTAPTARLGHRMIYDPNKDRVVLYGGEPNNLFNPTNIKGDTWELSFAGSADGAWKELFASGAPGTPPKRRDVIMAFEAKRKLLIMFGGAFSFDMYADDLWVFDLTSDTWRKLTTAGDVPSARFAGRMDWDEKRDQFVLFGGHDLELRNDSFTLTLDTGAATGTFTQIRPGDSGTGIGELDLTSPERRQRHAQVLDGDRLWIFGGGTDCSGIDDTQTLDLTAPSAWLPVYKAMVGETCARRAQPGQQCPPFPDLCAAPF